MKKQLIFILAAILVVSAVLTSCSFFKKEEVTEAPQEEHVCVAGKWVISSYPTDTQEGIKQKVCVECGAVLLEEALASSDGLSYELYQNSVYHVTGIGTCTDTDVVIPNTYKGLPVVQINANAFSGYTAISSVTIGDNVVIISANAFRNCTSLAKVYLPKSLTYVEDGAFYNCSFLENVYYDGELLDWLNINFLGTTANPTNNGTNLYINNELLENLVIPEDIVIVPEYSFINCNSLLSLVIGDSVKAINPYAFADCANLATVQLGNETLKIGDYAFSNCVKLTEVSVPGNVRILGNYAFHKCTSLHTFTFGDKLSTVGEYAFAECTSLRTINIKDSVVKINNYAFNNCVALEYINYDGSADTWAMINFTHSSSNPMHLNKAKAYFKGELVKNIVINKATAVNAYAFYKCSSLESVVLGDSVTSIGAYAFQGCPVLESAKLNANIGEGVFADCPYFESIELGKNVKSIGAWAFSNDTYFDSITYDGIQSEWDAVSKGYRWNNNISSNLVINVQPDPVVDPETPADAE